MIVSTLGTSFLPSMRDAVLVLEEVDEQPYRVDRMLAQLRNAGIDRKISGLVFGKFIRCEAKDLSKPHFTIEEVLEEFSRTLQIPVLANLQYGHVPKKLTVPFGLQARMDTTKGRIEVLEGAVN